MSIPQFFESDRAGIEEALDRLLPQEEAQPASIHKAMRYSVFAGGKRIRPILCLEAARDVQRESGRGRFRRLRARIHPHLFADSR